MIITREIVDYAADLAKIRLDEEQKNRMQDEIGQLVNYMDILNEVDTDGITPVSHVFDVHNVFREDTIIDSYDRNELLKNAPVHTDSSVVVPKTVE